MEATGGETSILPVRSYVNVGKALQSAPKGNHAVVPVVGLGVLGV